MKLEKVVAVAVVAVLGLGVAGLLSYGTAEKPPSGVLVTTKATSIPRTLSGLTPTERERVRLDPTLDPKNIPAGGGTRVATRRLHKAMLNPQETQPVIERLAQQCRGDFIKLSAEDREFVTRLTAGHGKELMQSTYRYSRSTNRLK